MGVPVSPRNIFPSNIQGLPTWYEVRVIEHGWRGRRGGVDLMVAMNPQTWDKDVAEIEPGGYLFYDSTKPLPPSKFRDDVNVARRAADRRSATPRYTDPRAAPAVQEHHLSRRAGGAARHRARGDRDAARRAVQGQGASCSSSNLQGASAGLRLRAASTSTTPLGLKVERRDAVGKRIFIDGNTAAALGCVYGGATVCAWYPITPSSSLAEAFQKYCRKLRVDPATGKQQATRSCRPRTSSPRSAWSIGAGWNGARAFTATSGPGISLMQEFIGLAYFAEIPVVIFDVQRGGPSTGMPTRTQQADLLSLRLRVARRHQARAAVPRGSERVLRVRGARRSTSPTGCRRRCS